MVHQTCHLSYKNCVDVPNIPDTTIVVLTPPVRDPTSSLITKTFLRISADIFKKCFQVTHLILQFILLSSLVTFVDNRRLCVQAVTGIRSLVILVNKCCLRTFHWWLFIGSFKIFQNPWVDVNPDFEKQCFRASTHEAFLDQTRNSLRGTYWGTPLITNYF